MTVDSTSTLSPIARTLWAKTGIGEESLLYSPLYVHMTDCGEIARLLWHEWLPESIKLLFKVSLELDDTLCENAIAWFATVHDIGKATPTFQCKNLALAERVQEQGLVIHPAMLQGFGSIKHSTMSEVILRRWLDEGQWDSEHTEIGCAHSHTYSVVVGGHHGIPPSNRAVRECKGGYSIALGDTNWK